MSFEEKNLLPKKSLGIKKTKKAGHLIRCECGFEILLVPDVKAMGKAIETHAAEHGKKEKDPAMVAAEEERIQDFLIAQILKAAVSK